MINFVSDLRQVGGFFRYSTNKTDLHDIAEILLKVALNTITSNKKVTVRVDVVLMGALFLENATLFARKTKYAADSKSTPTTRFILGF